MLQNPKWNEAALDHFSISNICRRAADLLEVHGHVKCRLVNDKGSMCLLGAINKATTGSACEVDDVRHEVCRAIIRTNGLGFITNECRTVIEWNNAPQRTAEEVIHALRLTAATTGS